jgi:hypothetical protein
MESVTGETPPVFCMASLDSPAWRRNVMTTSFSIARPVVGALCFVGVIGVAGCLGPASVRHTRSEYNDAVHTTGNEELLLNFVRLRYGEGVSFLPITSINAQFEFSAGVLGRGGVDRGGASNYGQGQLGFTDRPTLTFDPRRSPEVTKALLTRCDLDTFDLLEAAGWDLERMLRLLMILQNTDT